MRYVIVDCVKNNVANILVTETMVTKFMKLNLVGFTVMNCFKTYILILDAGHDGCEKMNHNLFSH